jgi:molybdopterin-guanine dinucleotide biosynthesis protein A
MSDFTAVVLAGGSARRLGGVIKPALEVGGVALLTRVLAALEGADPVVVVGPPGLDPLLPVGVGRTWEDPPGGGPVAGAHAGLEFVRRTAKSGPSVVALLAADLPFLSTDVMSLLRTELAGSGADGAVLVDEADRPQWLCGVWRASTLAGPLARAATGASLRATLGELRVHRVGRPGRAWFDCDTEEELDAARRWAHADAG